MEPEARIDRMLASGLISPQQAADLRASVSRGRAPEPKAPQTRSMPWGPIALGALAIALLGVVAVLGSAGGPQQVQVVAETLNQPESIGVMNKLLSLVLALFLLVALPVVIWVWLHNALVSKEERTMEAWAQVESNFQRRADLIPALVEAVTRYLQHESDTLTSVTEARGKALASAMSELIGAQKDANAILERHGKALVEDESAFAALEQAERTLGGRMSNLLAVAEQYPQLRSSDQFLALEAEIEGTENRINVARMRFNSAVAEYNASIRRIPGSLVASVGGFGRKAYFQAEPGAAAPPALDLR